MVEKLFYMFVFLILILVTLLPILTIIRENKYTKDLINYMEYSVGRKLTQRERDQIVYRFNPMYKPFWINDLEEAYRKGVVFKIPPVKEKML